MDKKFPIKLAAYSAFILYLIGDLYVWHGFLATSFDAHFKPMPNPYGDASAIAATVYGEPITQNQLAFRTKEIAWMRGKGSTLLSPQQTAALQLEAMADLIDTTLLRNKTKVNDLQISSPATQARFYASQAAKHFPSQEAYLQALHSIKSKPEYFAQRLESRLKQHTQLLKGSETAINVPEEIVRAYYERIKDAIIIPESRQVSHIFFATLDKDPEQVKAHAQRIITLLAHGANFVKQGKDFAQMSSHDQQSITKLTQMVCFAELAEQESEDSRTAPRGGTLGILFNNSRLAHLKLTPDLFSIPAHHPTLLQSKIGFHVVFASPITPARVPTYEEAHESIRSAIIAQHQVEATRLYTAQLRDDAKQKGRILRNK